MSNVVGLYTCADAGQPMEAQTQARALAGSGFAGDRYATNQGTFSRSARPNMRQNMRHVSLIAREAIEEANRDLVARGLPPFGVHETRRNIITEGVDVNALLGREFRIGDVRLRGTEPTKPCPRPSALVQKTGFRGGVRRARRGAGRGPFERHHLRWRCHHLRASRLTGRHLIGRHVRCRHVPDQEQGTE